MKKLLLLFASLLMVSCNRKAEAEAKADTSRDSHAALEKAERQIKTLQAQVDLYQEKLKSARHAPLDETAHNLMGDAAKEANLVELLVETSVKFRQASPGPDSNQILEVARSLAATSLENELDAENAWDEALRMKLPDADRIKMVSSLRDMARKANAQTSKLLEENR